MFEHKLIVNLHTPYGQFRICTASLLLKCSSYYFRTSHQSKKKNSLDKHRNARRYEILIGWPEAQNIKNVHQISHNSVSFELI